MVPSYIGLLSRPRLEDRALPRSHRPIVGIPRLVLRVAAPGQIAIEIAMLRPPPVPFHQRLKRILQEPPIVKLLVEPQHRNGAHRRLAAVRALPPAGPRIVRHKPLPASPRAESPARSHTPGLCRPSPPCVAAKNVSQSNRTYPPHPTLHTRVTGEITRPFSGS